MSIRTEMYAPTAASADAMWEVVGDPWQLAAWTDGERVESVTPEPLAKGSEIVIVDRDAVRTWLVTTVQPRLRQIELTTDLPDGQLSLGYRVIAQQPGCRLVIAAALEPVKKVGGVRARLVELPALRKRLDHWTERAVKAAEERDRQSRRPPPSTAGS